MAYTTIPLSGSTNGKPIEVTGINSAASVLVHTAVNVAGDYDEVQVFANNTSASAVDVTFEVGGTAQENLIKRTIPAKTTKFCIEDIRLDTGVVINVFSSVANVVNVYGKVGRTE